MVARQVIFAMLDGGLGDNIARLPAVRYINNNFKYVNALVLVPDYFKPLARELLPEHERLTYLTFDELRNQPWLQELPAHKTGGPISTLRMSLVDNGFLNFADKLPDCEEDRYYPQYTKKNVKLKRLSIAERFLVLTPGYTAPVREWPADQINRVIDWCVSKGIQPVLLGSSSVRGDVGKFVEGQFDTAINAKFCLNLIGRTTLVEAVDIMNQSLGVVGLDNGLLHLAGCTDKPIIAAYTNVKPELRTPHRPFGDTYVVTAPGCIHCQSSTNYFYGFDYKTCINSKKACNRKLNPALFISALEQIIKG